MTKLEALKIQHRVERHVLCMEQALDLVELKDGDTMLDPKVADFVAKMDVATNAIGARIQKLIDGGTLSAESSDALQKEVDALTALGADPNNPIPTPTPVA